MMLTGRTAAAAEAVEYETVVFKISGGGTRDDPITPYEGPPTPEKDMRWYELINGQHPNKNLPLLQFILTRSFGITVGMISLTPEMNKTLKHPTQPASKEDNTPLVQLDVFHQLHCLNSIRNIVYGTNPWYNPDDRQDQIHIGIHPLLAQPNQPSTNMFPTDHCLDYLRQVCTYSLQK
jgi:Mycotoxin biosynthesis protein UstYa